MPAGGADIGLVPSGGEGVADPVNGSDEARRLRFVAERLAHLGDHDRQIRVADEGSRPEPGVQLLFGDRIRPALEQDTEGIERLAGQVHRLPAAQELPAWRS